VKGLLIGGTTHCGKSTLARRISEALNWRSLATDQLGRHPGRPWLDIPPPVVEFYEALSDDAISWFHRVHHDNLWPLLARTIADEASRPGGFVLEGSALRPEKVATLAQSDVIAICLYAPPDFLEDRVRRESGYFARDAAARRLIDKFLERSLRDNEDLADAARQYDIALYDVSKPEPFESAVQVLIRQGRS
jgi:2-phosphoglycerate kinase